MGIRTVRLSGAMKRGLLVLRDEVVREGQRVPYDIYKELDLGPGGYAVAPAARTRHGVQAAVRRKLRR